MKFYCRDKQIVQFLNLYLICALEWLEDISPDPIWKEQKRCPFLGLWDRNSILSEQTFRDSGQTFELGLATKWAHPFLIVKYEYFQSSHKSHTNGKRVVLSPRWRFQKGDVDINYQKLMLLRNNQTTPTDNDSLDLSLFDDLTFNDLENGVKGKHFQVS